MPDRTDNSARAFQEIVRVLEEAVRAGVNSIGLEYKGQELMVFYQAGPLGLGAGRAACRSGNWRCRRTIGGKSPPIVSSTCGIV